MAEGEKEQKLSRAEVEKQLRATIAELSGELVRERQRASAVGRHGHVQLLRDHLRQELACGLYLTENLKDGTPEFNSLPLEKRKSYFHTIDNMHGEPDRGSN